VPQVAITTEPLFHTDGPHLAILEEAGLTACYPSECPVRTEDGVVAALQSAVGVLAGGEPYTESVLSRLPHLRVISRAGVGYDRVDVDAAAKRGIAVTITPNANHEAVAEQTFALLLAVTRLVVGIDREIRAGGWPRPPLVPLRGMVLGLVGMGRIGRSVAVRARAFGLRVLAADPVVTADDARQLGVELVDFASVLSQSDFVSLHLPLNPATRRIIDAQALALMKAGSSLINTARGGLVDEEALARALQSGQLAGAGLDAFAEEPLPPDHPFLRVPNVVLSSHVAGNDTRSINDMAADAARNIVDVLAGRLPAASMVNVPSAMR
jgi:phosphoglycerate dehydrogenase-like enzyme